MMRNDGFERTVSDWLDEQAGRGAPGYLDEVLARTTRTRQRPAWSSLERWLPVQTTLRLAPVPRLAWLALVLALVLALAAVVLFAGGGRKLPAPFGTAGNGLIAYVDGSTIMVAEHDGTNARLLLAGRTEGRGLAWSPDGTRLALIARPIGAQPGLVIVDADGAHPLDGTPGLTIDVEWADPPSWSPDGRQLVLTDGKGRLFIANADGSGVRSLGDPATLLPLERSLPAWSPDGRFIAFMGQTSQSAGGVYVIEPDGRNERLLQGTGAEVQRDFGGVAWAPDPRVQRLLFTAGPGPAPVVTVYDMASGSSHAVGSGFWPTWSPDGSRIAWADDTTKVVNTADLLAGRAEPFALDDHVDGYCPDHPELAGIAICGPPVWSPDGTKVFAIDVMGTSIVALHVDRSGPPVRVATLAIKGDTGPRTRISWQRTAP